MQSKIKIQVLITRVVAIVCCFVCMGESKVLYVDNSGEATSGLYKAASVASGTEARPFSAIQKAAYLAIAGDEVWVKKGIYQENLILSNSGTPWNKIIFKAIQPKSVKIQGTIIIKGDNVRIEGFHIDGASLTQPGLFKAAGTSQPQNGLTILAVNADVIGMTFTNLKDYAIKAGPGAKIQNNLCTTAGPVLKRQAEMLLKTMK